MYRKQREKLPDPSVDPFGERAAMHATREFQLLGARVHFESNSRALLRLVDSAYAGLPTHRLPRPPPRLRVRLVLTADGPRRRGSEPPAPAMLSAPGLLCGATPSSNFVIVSPTERSALVTISPRMLESAYHTRYELIEFAVFTLAARVQGLVPLHAACVGRDGRGVLLMGPSGAGKSTVALQSLLQGLDFLAEDSVFVAPNTLLATGIANFVHLRADSVRWIERDRDAAAIRRSPVIRRRSGVRKFERDLRNSGYRLAGSAMQIAAIAFLSPQAAGAGPVLNRLPRSALPAQLAACQGYAANQPEWRAFSKRADRLEAFELRRGRHPRDAVEALCTLLDRAAP
jgi:hypothetical protein